MGCEKASTLQEYMKELGSLLLEIKKMFEENKLISCLACRDGLLIELRRHIFHDLSS